MYFTWAMIGYDRYTGKTYVAYPGLITPLPGIKSYQEPEKNTVFVVFSGGQLHFDLLNTSQLLIILWRRGITQL